MTFPVVRALLLVPLVIAASCSDDGNSKRDAAIDAPADTAPSPCGSDQLLAGELVDWDSTGAGDSFCGVLGATWQVHGDATRTDTTPPNGRVQLCLAAATTTQIDITPPTDPSPCLAAPGTYTLPALFVASQAVIATGKTFSVRDFTSARAGSANFGATIDPAKAQVYVDEIGGAAAASLAASHDPSQAYDGSAWAAGSAGSGVFFPNVDPTAGTTTLAVTGATAGPTTVPVVAGHITYVAVVTP
jgi:hypothetical protein